MVNGEDIFGVTCIFASIIILLMVTSWSTWWQRYCWLVGLSYGWVYYTYGLTTRKGGNHGGDINNTWCHGGWLWHRGMVLLLAIRRV